MKKKKKKEVLMQILTFSTLYLATLSLAINSLSVIMMWVILELNMIVVSLMMKSCQQYSKNSYAGKSSVFIYFIFQTIGSMLFLLASYKESSMYISNYTQDVFMALALSLKMGVFPFQFWLYMIVKEGKPAVSSLIMVPQKIPTMMMALHMPLSFLVLISFVNIAVGSWMLLMSVDLVELLVSSSFFGLMWLASSFSMGVYFMLMFMATYFLAVKELLSGFKQKMSTEKKAVNLYGFSFLAGIPTLSMFFVKMTVFLTWIEPDVFLLVILFMGSAASFVAYAKMLMKTTIYPNVLMKSKNWSNSTFTKKMTVFLILLGFGM